MEAIRRAAGVAALAAAVGGFLYGYFFAVAGITGVASLLLMAGGLLASLVIVALATSLFEVNEPLARWALLIGVVASLLSVIHGGNDLANVINPPEVVALGLPNPADPRGIATFGFTGLALLILATLMTRSSRYPTGLARSGQALGIVAIIIYLGRLIILDPTHPVVRVALVLGVVANTVFYLWLGRHWLRPGS
jgi:hypothetical protein